MINARDFLGLGRCLLARLLVLKLSLGAWKDVGFLGLEVGFQESVGADGVINGLCSSCLDMFS